MEGQKLGNNKTDEDLMKADLDYTNANREKLDADLDEGNPMIAKDWTAKNDTLKGVLGETEFGVTNTTRNTLSIEVQAKRGIWPNKCEFFLAIMGYTIGVGSVWRFPFICSRNGGGAFLIPFFLFMITSGGPLYYLEVCIGQFSGKSAGLAFEFCPLFKGIGLLQVILSLTVTWYLVVVLVWILYFLYNSFFPTLPWSTCGNKWNTDNCIAISELWSGIVQNASFMQSNISSDHDDYNASSDLFSVRNNNYSENTNKTESLLNVITSELKKSSSAYEFWEYQVIGRSSGLEEMGSVQLHLLICLFIAWLLVEAAVIKGIRTLGKVVYVTATAPFLFITILFIKGLTLDGAVDGMIAFLKPDFSKLLTAQVWLDAAIQVYFALGPCWGGVITMSSYNPFHQKTFWSSTMCVVSAAFVSFYSGLVVFTILGFMASASGRTIEDIASESGPGLLFVVFPTVLSQMPIPQLWSVLFFIMMVAVSFDSLFGMFETVTSAIIDYFPHQLISRRTTVNILVGICYFVCGIPLTMNGGIYLFQLADWYFSTFALLVGSIFECISVCWIYGTDRFARDIEMMTGRKVCVLLRIMWGIVIPLSLIVLLIVILAQYSTPAYSDGYAYSTGAIAVGILIEILPIIAALFVGTVTVMTSKGPFLTRVMKSLKPSRHWIPHNREAEKEYVINPYTYPKSWWKWVVLNIRGKKGNSIF